MANSSKVYWISGKAEKFVKMDNWEIKMVTVGLERNRVFALLFKQVF